MNRRTAVAIVLGIALVAGCGSGRPVARLALFPDSVPPKPPGSPGAMGTRIVIGARSVRGLGRVLVDLQGHTLYGFTRDRRRFVTCSGGCATVWLPALLYVGQEPLARGAVRARLVSSVTNPTHGSVVSYAGYPLYAYTGDRAPGDARGEGRVAFGGRWYAVSAGGRLIHPPPPPAMK